MSDWALGEVLGRGGMGVVFAATHARRPGQFAVKRVRPDLLDDPKARAYFVREAKHSIRLQHPNIVRTVELFSRDDGLFLAMERLEGETVEVAMRPGGLVGPPPWPIAHVERLISDACAGLAHAHQHGLVHRDVKPGNLFLQRHGGAKLLDFGVCRVVGEASLQSTQSGPPGTPAYLPPEVLQGAPATPASDYFSLGLVAYQLLTGRLPHAVPEGSSPWATIAALTRAYHSPLPRVSGTRPDVPAALDALVARMLSLDPAQRSMSSAPTEPDDANLGPGSPGVGGASTSLGVRGLSADLAPPPLAAPAAVPASAPGAGTALGVRGLDVPVSDAVFDGAGRPSSSGAPTAGAPWLRPADSSAPAASPGTRLGVGELAPRPTPSPGTRPSGTPPIVHAPPAADGARRWLLGLGAVATVGLGGWWVRRMMRPSPPRVPVDEGWIRIESTPPGATFAVEHAGGLYEGETPSVLKGLSTTEGVQVATVRVRAPGVGERVFHVPVVPGFEQRVDVRF